MERYWKSGGAGTAPAAPASAVGYPTSGNPGGGVPASRPGPWWFHMVTEELRRVITDAGLTPDHTNLAQLSQAIVLLSPSVAPGAGVAFWRNTAPPGWLKANGALVSRTTYAALFAAIGTTFGVGDGSTTFALPDVRGKFLRGWDDGRGLDAGRVFGSSQSPSAIESKVDNNGALVVSNPDTTTVLANDNGFSAGAVSSARSRYTLRPDNLAPLYCIKF
jgi:microcystin-dependent protein